MVPPCGCQTPVWVRPMNGVASSARAGRMLEVHHNEAAPPIQQLCPIVLVGPENPPPVTRSPRITSAPRSANIIAQNGPGPIDAISTTLVPRSGPVNVGVGTRGPVILGFIPSFLPSAAASCRADEPVDSCHFRPKESPLIRAGEDDPRG